MTTLLGYAPPGHIVPGTKTPIIEVYTPFGWKKRRIQRGIISTTPYGPPIKPEPRVQPVPKGPTPQSVPGTTPKPIGDELHLGVLEALHSLAKETSKMTEALPGYRQWR